MSRIIIGIGMAVIFMLLSGCEEEHIILEESICVMTYNIHYGSGPGGDFDIDRIAGIIMNSGAQIVALQEVDRVWGKRSRFLDEAAYLAASLNMEYVFGATLDKDPSQDGTGEYGLMILSKFPIRAWDFHFLPGELEQRGVLLAWIDIYGVTVPIACTHLGLSPEDRQAQISEILAWMPADDNMLLLGDFNAEPDEPCLVELKKSFFDIQDYYGLGNEGTFLYDGRSVRIDYLFTRTKWRIKNCRVIKEDASDHFPVVAEIIPLAES